jgi:hypothetical protein
MKQGTKCAMKKQIKQEQVVCEYSAAANTRYTFDELPGCEMLNRAEHKLRSCIITPPVDAGSSRTNLAPLFTWASWEAVE